MNVMREPFVGDYTPAEVARETGVSVATVHRWISTGRLPATNISTTGGHRRYRLRRSDIEAFLKTLRAEAG